MVVNSNDLKSRSNSQQDKIDQRVQMTDADVKFLVFCRDLGWGKVELLVKNGKPAMGSVIRQDFRFDV